MKKVIVFGTFDTKGEEYAFLISQLAGRGINAISIDLGTMRDPPFKPTYSAGEVAGEAKEDLRTLHKRMGRAQCLEIMAGGAQKICRRLMDSGEALGIISMGGGQGTYLAGMVFREMPVGIPKILMSTVANMAETASYFEGINDTLVMNALVDVAGLNPIMCTMTERIAAAMAGMLAGPVALPKADASKPRIAISMWGVTTPCVTAITGILEAKGYEVYTFHATGPGGGIMENLAEQNFFSGIIDLTMPEVSVPFIGGEYVNVPTRLTKAGTVGIPRVISVGGIDMVCFTAPFNMPDRFQNRKHYLHNPEFMFVRSSPAENAGVGREMARRLNLSKGDVKVVLPLRGISAVDIEGNIMYDPEADAELFKAIRENLSTKFEVIERDNHINDSEFAAFVARIMCDMLEK